MFKELYRKTRISVYMSTKQKYLVFVDDRGRYHADLNKKRAHKDVLVDDANFGIIFKNQNQEMNGQDTYGLFFIPEDDAYSFKLEYEALELNLQHVLNDKHSELKSSHILGSINSSIGLFLQSEVVYFYMELMTLIERHHGFFHLARIDWVDVFLIKRLKFFIDTKQLDMKQLRCLVKYMYQYATPQLKKQLYQFDVPNGEFFDLLFKDIVYNIHRSTVENNPYGKSRASWLGDRFDYLSQLEFTDFNKSEHMSFQFNYNQIESEFLLDEIKLYLSQHNIDKYSIFVDTKISVEGSNVIKSDSQKYGYGIRVVDVIIGYISKLITALIKLLHNDYPKNMNLKIQSIPDKFWFPDYLSELETNPNANVGWATHAIALEILNKIRKILIDSIFSQRASSSLSVYTDNYDILISFIDMYTQTTFKYRTMADYEKSRMPDSKSLQEIYHDYRLVSVLLSEVNFIDAPIVIPQYIR